MLTIYHAKLIYVFIQKVHRVYCLRWVVESCWHLVAETFEFLICGHCWHLSYLVRYYVEGVAVLEETWVEASEEKDAAVVQERHATALSGSEAMVVYGNQVPWWVFVLQVEAFEGA